MRRIALIFAALVLSGCGMVWKISYTFPATVGLEIQAQVQPVTFPATQPEARP